MYPYHLIHCIIGWSCFKSYEKDISSFYVKCIEYVTQVHDIIQFENVIVAILIVALSSSNEEGTNCFRIKKVLTALIQPYSYNKEEFRFEKPSEKFMTAEEVTRNENKKKKMNDLETYIEDLFNTAESLSTTAENASPNSINYFHCPEIESHLKKLCCQFPAFTLMMDKYFNTTSAQCLSARSEAEFKELKKRIPDPLHTQKFMFINLENEKYKSINIKK